MRVERTLDPVQMARRRGAALAGCAALTGGADIVELTRYRGGAAAVRLTLQQLRVMHDEAGLDVVADPFGGAGIVELLTDELVDEGRRELARLRRLGGFLAAERDDEEHLILGMFNLDRPRAIHSFRKLAELDFDIACVGHGKPLDKDASLEFRRVAATLAND